MTIKEERVLKNYIKGLVKESILPSWYDSWRTSTPKSWEDPGVISKEDFMDSYVYGNNLSDSEKRDFIEWVRDAVDDDPNLLAQLANDENPIAYCVENGVVDWADICSDFLDIHPVEWYKSDYEEDRSGPDGGLYEGRKRLHEMDDDDRYYGGGLPDHYFDDPDDKPLDYEDDEESAPAGLEELRKLCEGFAREALFDDEEDDEDFDFDGDEEFDDEHYAPFHTQDYGIYELRKVCEGMARSAVKTYLNEDKKKNSKKGKKGKKSKKGKESSKGVGSQEKTIMTKLNSDEVNAASYYYKLYGVENGTEDEKAAARSKGYKKAKGKKNDSGARYKFSSKERNRLNSMLTDK